MSHDLEEQLGHIGAKLDHARDGGKERVDRLVDRLEALIDELHGDLDDLKVQAGLAKLEVKERSLPVIESLRNRSLDARAALVELREELRPDVS